MNRRNFIKNMSIYASAVSLSSTSLFGVNAGSSKSFSDYKAIVILDMDGGNDAMNMFPPTGTIPHATYASIRTNLAVSNVDLTENQYYNIDSTTKHFVANRGANQPYWVEGELNSETGKEEMYTKGSYHLKNPDGTQSGLGINGLMPEFASLYNNGKLAVVSNTGVLIEPITAAELNDPDSTKRKPGFLFSHGNQRELIATLQAGMSMTNHTGWAGRLADTWNIDNPLGLNISYGGASRLFMGLTTSGFTTGLRGPSSYANVNNRIGLFDDLLLDLADNPQSQNIFDRFSTKINKNTATLSKNLKNAWDDAPHFSSFSAKNPYGDTLFTSYAGANYPHRNIVGMRTHHGMEKGIFDQLHAAAKMIKVSKDNLSAQRQIFYVRQPGHDVHGGQVDGHSKLIRAISLSVSDFYKALEEMGLQEDVLLISASEFGRTMKNNADGTDHGWAGHNFMLCGDPKFNGGQVYGDVLQDLNLDGVNAYTRRARLIPTTALEQMLAPALKWFGVDDVNTMNYVFPNLSNFSTGESGYLDIFETT